MSGEEEDDLPRHGFLFVNPRFRRFLLVAGTAFLLSACSSSQDRPGGALNPAGTEADTAYFAENISPSGTYLAGLIAGQNRDYSIAADLMLEALETSPDDPRLLARAFLLSASAGNNDDALALASRILVVSPDQSLAHLVLLVDAVKNEDWDLAGERIEASPDTGVNTILKPMFLAWTDLAKGNLDKAVTTLEPLSEKEGFQTLYGIQLALLNDLGGRPKEARAAYMNILEISNPPSLRQLNIIADFLSRQGDDIGAKDLLWTYLQSDPDSTIASKALKRIEEGNGVERVIGSPGDAFAEILFGFASLHAQEKAYDAGLVYAMQALRLRPEYEEAKILVGEIMQTQERSRDAIALYRTIPESSPYAWTVGLRIADELVSLDRKEEALDELRSMSKLRPERFEPHLRRGNILRASEKFKEASSAYDQAIERIDSADSRFWSVYYFRGITHERTDQWAKAEVDFLKALELSPDQPHVLNYLAYSWVELRKNLVQAEDMLIKAVELRPEDGYIVDSLGWVYYQLGKYDNAVNYLEQAIELKAEDPVINDHLGDAYWQVGRYHEARFQWKRALSFKPEDKQIEVIRAKIEQGLISVANGN
ncbi:tetratricopeptide repeat protein [Kiloniella laminariae]|uniref:tetratricopeptide repeat protein n=1 Tax=Kiloniella laminariae TaxID=454162 RepID=UPI0003656B5A|nr:tetratricopeptide repeat protein [Kiloniella laminariae]